MSLQTRLSSLISAIGADIKALSARVFDQSEGSRLISDPTNQWVGRWDITDDASPTAGWPDRLSFRFNGIRTGWFNEYGELRASAAKNSTIPLKLNAYSPSATSRILQVNDQQGGNEIFAVDVDGAYASTPHGMLPVMPVWTGTLAAYNALTPDPRVLYVTEG